MITHKMLPRAVRCKVPVLQRLPRKWLTTISYQEERIFLWQQEFQRQQVAQVQATQDVLTRGESLELAVHVPAGQILAFRGVAGASTSIDVLKQLQESGLPKFQALAALNKDTGELIDLRTPLQHSGTLQLLDFSTDEGKRIFWHSSAHVLGQALENKFQEQIRLTDGPALTEGGFFYEMYLQDKVTVSEADFDDITRRIQKIVKARQPFERLEVTREFAEKMFTYSELKRNMLHKIPMDASLSLYRCGSLIDLCRGPHVPHTGTWTLYLLHVGPYVAIKTQMVTQP